MGQAAVQLSLLTGNVHERHDPSATVLHRVMREHLETFLAEAGMSGDRFPRYVEQEFRDYLECGILAHGFLRVKCEACHEERLVAFSCKGRGFCPSCLGRRMTDTAAYLIDRVIPHEPVRQWVVTFPMRIRYILATNPKLVSSVLGITHRAIEGYLRRRAGCGCNIRTGGVTLVQRFGGSINLNLHFHMVLLDGVYDWTGRFHGTGPPGERDISRLIEAISKRVRRHLERKGYLGDDGSSGSDPLIGQSQLLAECAGASVQGMIAMGERRGERVRKRGNIREVGNGLVQMKGPRCAFFEGFSLHAETAFHGWQREKIERLLRYIARPPVANDRVTLTPDGQVLYRLKRAYDDGTTHLLFSPTEFLEKLAAIVPQPRKHQVRYHGAWAAHSRIRNKVIKEPLPDKCDEKAERPARYQSWAKLLARVFKKDVEHCPKCGGDMKIIAAIMKTEVIRQILDHLGLPSMPPEVTPARAPPLLPDMS